MIYLGIFLYLLAGVSIMVLFVQIEQIGGAVNEMSARFELKANQIDCGTLDNVWLRFLIVLIWPIFGAATLKCIFDT